MTRRVPWGLAVGVVLALGAAGGAWLWLSLADRPADGPPPPPAPSPLPPAYALEVALRRLKAIPVSGQVKKQKLRQPAEAVRQTFTDLYTTAFVDPARALRPLRSRGQAGACRHVDDLTLGRAAGHLTAVRPEWARLDVRFLLGPSRRPVAAQASMRVSATGFATDGSEVSVRQRGDVLSHADVIRGRLLGGDDPNLGAREIRSPARAGLLLRSIPYAVIGMSTRGEGFVYARVTVVQGSPEKIEQGIDSFNSEVLPAVKGVAGYKAAFLLADRKTGKGIGISLWESEDARRRGGEAVDAARAATIKAMGGSVAPVEEFEVVASDF